MTSTSSKSNPCLAEYRCSFTPRILMVFPQKRKSLPIDRLKSDKVMRLIPLKKMKHDLSTRSVRRNSGSLHIGHAENLEQFYEDCNNPTFFFDSEDVTEKENLKVGNVEAGCCKITSADASNKQLVTYWVSHSVNTTEADEETIADATLQGNDASPHENGSSLGGATSTGTANNSFPPEYGSNADAILQASDASLLGSNASSLGGDATGTGTASFPHMRPLQDATLQASDASLLGSDATGTGTASFPHCEATARQYVVDDTIFEGDTSRGDDPTSSGDSVSVIRAAATSTIPAADLTLGVTQLPYASADAILRDTATSTIPHADSTASVTQLPYARGTRSWFCVAPLIVALVVVLALLLSSADPNSTIQVSLVYWGLDRSAVYAREYVRRHVRRRVHSRLDPILSWFPPQVIMWLPIEYIPPEQISRIPMDHIASLPIEYLAEQPIEIIAQLAPEIVARLPTSVIAKLPVSSIHQIHLSPIRWFGVGFHSWQRLLSRVSQFVVSRLPTSAPTSFTSWILKFSLNAASIVVCGFIIEHVMMYVVGLLRRLRRRLGRHVGYHEEEDKSNSNEEFTNGYTRPSL